MVTFLNALILSAVALALIPVIIHLLNRKKTQVVPFSSLEFLKILQNKKIKRVKLQQIILLILRTLVLLLAVLAFARPVSKAGSSGSVDAHAKTSIVLIIDNSASASYVSDKGSVFERMQLKAEQIIDRLKEGDEALILPAAGSEQINGFSRNFGELKIQVKNLLWLYQPADIPSAIFKARQLLSSAKNVNREIYVLSDMQENGWSAQQESLADPEAVRPIFIDFGVHDLRNTGITGVTVLSKIIEKNKPIDLQIEVQNYGAQAIDELPVSVYLDGKRVAQSALSLAGSDAATFEIKITPQRAGFLAGHVELDDDPYLADNKRFFHIYVPEKISVLLAGQQADDVEFLSLALNPGGDFTSVIRTERTTPGRLTALNVGDFDVIIFSNVTRFEESHARLLESFLAKGGGVMIFPGKNADSKNYNTLLQKWRIGQMTQWIDQSAAQQFVQFGKIDYSHPVMAGMFDSGGKNKNEKSVESPHFEKYFKIENSGGSGKTIIQLTTNTPFMEEIAIGDGAVFLFASGVDLESSDLAVKGIFAPLINRSVSYLYSKRRGEMKNFIAGDLVEFRLLASVSQNIVIKDGEGRELIPKVKPMGNEALIEFPKVETPGNYALYLNDRLVERFDANVDPSENKLNKVLEKKMQAVLGENGYAIYGENDVIDDIILKSRFGTELWKWVLLAAVILLIAEMIIAQSHRFVKTETQL
ncbi:BatA domain-containing protein [bacterium]|nr:BatA domain-containing protein [bacterium]